MTLLQQSLHTQTQQSAQDKVWTQRFEKCSRILFSRVVRYFLSLTNVPAGGKKLPAFLPRKCLGSCGTAPGCYKQRSLTCVCFYVCFWSGVYLKLKLKQTVSMLMNITDLRTLPVVEFDERQKCVSNSCGSYQLFRVARVSKAWIVFCKEVRHSKTWYICSHRHIRRRVFFFSPLRYLNQFQTLGL